LDALKARMEVSGNKEGNSICDVDFDVEDFFNFLGKNEEEVL